MTYNWKLNLTVPDEYLELTHNLQIPKALAQVLYHRELHTENQLNTFFSCAPPPDLAPEKLKDLTKAIERIISAIQGGEKIIIYGDYDVDGITSAALLYLFFEVYNYYKSPKADVESLLPDRVHEGYGLKIPGVDKAIALGAKLIITVDNGISSHDAIIHAKSHDIDVIIIDHHRVPEEIPPAHAIINPKQKDCGYNDSGLSAVGLVYKLCDALGSLLLDESARSRFLNRYIDYVAIGTYQDMAPLLGENRYFVKRGMEELERVKQRGNTNLIGVTEILKLAGQIDKPIDTRILGFHIGPVINAAGRISSAQKAYRLLITRDPDEAKELSIELIKINHLRRDMTTQAVKEAVSVIESQDLHHEDLILLQSESWHQGIIGLVAQQIKDRFKKTCIAMTRASSPYYTGSARAHGAMDIGGLLQSLSHHFIHHGGHKKAAGFSISPDDLSQFREDIFRKIKEQDFSDETPELRVEAELNLADLTAGFMDKLSLLEPYGEGNPQPVFAIFDLEVLSVKKSKRGLDSLIRVSQNGGTL
ncbi:MAG: single-stranded-DNA-specific exonuclease RecJ, partial [Spirochaetota bacterium]|nr:single-stranded-DNA-specific exonuclease RecJ [Spirochaetota bacterium]